MASLSTQTTTITLDSAPWSWGKTTVAISKEQQSDIWKPQSAIVASFAPTLPIGAKLLGGLSILSIVSFLLICITIYQPLPLISPKFALFLTMLFGGLSLELLLVKKLNKK